MKGNEIVIANLMDAAAGEAHIALQLKLDARVMKAFGVKSVASKLGAMAGDSEDYLHKQIVRRLLALGSDAQYDAGTITSGDPVSAILKNALALITDLATKYEGYCKQAWDVDDDETRNIYEHLIKWHNKSIVWLERQINLIDVVGGDAQYVSAKI